MTTELSFVPAHELVRRIQRRDLSPVELMQATLARIEAVNPPLNAFVALRAEEALREARALADRLARGEAPGPLAGLPFGVKDLEDAAGLPTTYGSVPFKNNRPACDSVQVERLKKAGAIVVGKTNAPEFGYTAMTKNLLFGVTRNPWNLERTPGGSSGGSAAAVASGMVPFATSSDGGGSIRIPACYTGTFGLKPNYGRIPKGPVKMFHWSDTSVVGPITRSVLDAALYMDAAVGAHPADPDSLPHPGYSYIECLDRLPKGLRVAFNPTLGYALVQRDVMREVQAAVKVFEDFAHVELHEEPIPDLGLDWALVGGAEVYADICELVEEHRGEWGRSFLAGLERTRHAAAREFGHVQRARVRLNDALWKLFDRFDLLLTPTLPTEAFGASGPFPTEINGEPLQTPLGAVAFTYPFNLSGHPASSVRAGFTDSGMPCGLQIVAPRHREDLVLQASYAYEQRRPWNDKWPVDIAQP